jgi:membrane protein implicated in regulation of membrane protease activity
MFDWIGEHLWAAWLILALGLAVIEVLTLDLLFLMLAAGAAAGALTALVGGGGVISAIVSFVVAISMIGVVRPVALRHLKQGPSLRTGTAALVGKQAIVVERIDAQGGRVKLEGEVWSARAYDSTATIEPGKTVDVFQIDGATAYVHEVDEPL